ncbi:hypothetical protein MK805_08010 [Shimazuella sp. AN120528]|uniref:hypothetical protein n=1 Tax=Shimazuella soli TaxID=1892854 RepID=UPI001F0E0DC5|nr:hypothetical protein [Shimazuella soli]MCH5584916.1 hypothetical protein [Shimazuella soli]
MLTMHLKGDSYYIEAFVTHLKTQPFFTLLTENRIKEGEVELNFTTNLFKPSLSPLSVVELVTVDERVIQIELLHPVEIRVDEHIRQISGFSYDIFAAPQR